MENGAANGGITRWWPHPVRAVWVTRDSGCYGNT
jgi:hypothetical protein